MSRAIGPRIGDAVSGQRARWGRRPAARGRPPRGEQERRCLSRPAWDGEEDEGEKQGMNTEAAGHLRNAREGPSLLEASCSKRARFKAGARTSRRIALACNAGGARGKRRGTHNMASSAVGSAPRTSSRQRRLPKAAAVTTLEHEARGRDAQEPEANEVTTYAS